MHAQVVVQRLSADRLEVRRWHFTVHVPQRLSYGGVWKERQAIALDLIGFEHARRPAPPKRKETPVLRLHFGKPHKSSGQIIGWFNVTGNDYGWTSGDLRSAGPIVDPPELPADVAAEAARWLAVRVGVAGA